MTNLQRSMWLLLAANFLMLTELVFGSPTEPLFGAAGYLLGAVALLVGLVDAFTERQSRAYDGGDV